MLSGEGGGRMEDKDFLELIISERMGMHHDTFKKEYPLTEKQAAEAEKAAFLTKRQWDREKACFELGDQVAALEKMKSLISSIKEPSEKQRAIRDLEFLLLSPAEQAKLREERMNRRMPGVPRF